MILKILKKEQKLFVKKCLTKTLKTADITYGGKTVAILSMGNIQELWPQQEAIVIDFENNLQIKSFPFETMKQTR